MGDKRWKNVIGSFNAFFVLVLLILCLELVCFKLIWYNSLACLVFPIDLMII